MLYGKETRYCGDSSRWDGVCQTLFREVFLRRLSTARLKEPRKWQRKAGEGVIWSRGRARTAE